MCPTRSWWAGPSLTAAGVAGGEQDGETPTYVAARDGHVECIDALARHGADVNKAKRVRGGLVGWSA